MGRRNTSSSLARWNEAQAVAPYRASVGRDVSWDVGRPSPNLCAAMRVCRGGTLMIAFEVASVRDYFVAGHRDVGARAEPDHAARPTRRERARCPAVVPAPASLDACFQERRAAGEAYAAAIAAVEAAFQPDIDRLIATGAMQDALGLIDSLPDLVLKTLSISKLLDLGHDFKALGLHQGTPTPLTQARGAALAVWWEARSADREADDRMGAFLAPILRDHQNRGDLAGLEALLAIAPAGFARAGLADTIFVMKRAAAKARETA